MQLTKDDVKEHTDYNDKRKHFDVIDFSKFQQVVEFYEKYKEDKEGLMEKETKVFLIFIHQHTEGQYKTQEELDKGYSDWLFNYCFKDGLK